MHIPLCLCIFILMNTKWTPHYFGQLFCLIVLFVSCQKDPTYPAFSGQSRCENGIQDPDEYGVDCGGACNPCENTRYLEGEIFRRLSLDRRYTYILTGPLVIRDQGSLELPAGTDLRVRAGVGAYIAVVQGGSLFVWGTRNDPVTISSVSPTPQTGDWGGIIMCGLAPLEDSSVKRSPLGDYFYGGDLPNDTSGYLNYLKIEHAGTAQDDENIFNALSLYGVGRFTQINHLWIDGAAHNGIGIDGGNVPLDDLLVTRSGGNGIDLLSNWKGQGHRWQLTDNTFSGLRITDIDAASYTSSFTLNTLSLLNNTTVGLELQLEQSQARLSNLYIQGSPLGIALNPHNLHTNGLRLENVYLSSNNAFSNSASFNAQHQNQVTLPFENPTALPEWTNAW